MAHRQVETLELSSDADVAHVNLLLQDLERQEPREDDIPPSTPKADTLFSYVLSKGSLTLLKDGKRDAATTSLISSVVRRPLRLYIPTLGVTLAYAILIHAPFGLVPESSWAPPKLTLIAEILNWIVESVKFFNPFQIHGSNRAWYSYNLVVWTIPIELKGSMLVYGLVAVYAFSRLSLLASLALLGFAALVLLYLGIWTMACFMAGLLLAYNDVYSLDTTYITRRLTQRTQTILEHGVFFTGYYLLCQPAHDGHPEYSLDTLGWHYLTLLVPGAYDKSQFYRFWHSYGAFFVVFSTLRISWLQRFLNTRPLRYLGKVSFMLYLIHLSILNIFGNRIARLLGQVWMGAEESWWDNRLYIPDFGPVGMSSRFLVCLVVMLAICLGIADFGTKTLDTPSVRLGKWLVQRLRMDERVAVRKEAEVAASLPEPLIHAPIPS
ncbi:MAG: hypothetical protein M1820_009269 [Bogoriella megaspora]|nr:MAG: hypothetical protein M1820_009269 [Bogoriella megaspora]